MERWIIVVATLAVAVATGCSSTAAPTVTATPASAPQPPSTTMAAPLAQVGQALTNRGVTLTVKSAKGADSIEMNESGARPGSGFESYTKVKPDAGGKFIIVQTHIVNNAKTSMDLTCSLPITTKVADDQDRSFDTIADLYKIRGNPECNKLLQPGFESDMTYAYLVPASTTIVRWGFYDSTTVTGDEGFTRVQLTI